MIFWRALQGFIGGGMIPTVFASAFTIFPRANSRWSPRSSALSRRSRRRSGRRSAAISPTAFSWHWLFLVNLVPGIIVTIAAWLLIDFDEPDFSLLTRFDCVGLVSMAGFLGAMEYALEEGPSKDWFESPPVTTPLGSRR